MKTLQIAWTASINDTWFCQHGKYFLKKKVIAGNDLFQVWKGEQLKFRTEQEHEFLQVITERYQAA